MPVLKQVCENECLNASDDIETLLEFNGISISCVKLANLLEALNSNVHAGGMGLKLASQFKLGDTGVRFGHDERS